MLKRNPHSRLNEFLAENGEAPPDAARWFEGRGRRILGVRPFLPFQTRAVARRLLRVLDELALRRGRSRWIEKTPRHLRYVPFLERVSGPVRRTRFVHVIRDGLEVVASLHRASKSWERPYGLATCVRRWNADVGFSLGRVGAPDDHFVFYEELTSRPEATLRRLLTDLGLGWEPGILEQYGRTAHRLATEEEAWKGDVGRSIRTSGTSHRALTAEEREQVIRSLQEGLYERLRELAGRRSGAAARGH
jgi:hypothetical protein